LTKVSEDSIFGFCGRFFEYDLVSKPSTTSFTESHYRLEFGFIYRFRLWLPPGSRSWGSTANYVVVDLRGYERNLPIGCKIAFPNRSSAVRLSGDCDSDDPRIGKFFDLFSLRYHSPWVVYNTKVFEQLCLAVNMSLQEGALFVKNLFWRVTNCCIPDSHTRGLITIWLHNLLLTFFLA